MLLIRPDATEQERDNELDSLVKILNDNGATEVFMEDRGEQPLAYSIQEYVFFPVVLCSYNEIHD